MSSASDPNQTDENTSPGGETTVEPEESNSWLPEALKQKTSILTRAKFFEKLAHWAFTVCDGNGTGQINKDELYAGILWVHLYLAKYVGAAACYPPRRPVVERLFLAFDTDKSGFISENEFVNILQICSVDIASRIAVYMTILILLVPYLADALIRSFLHCDEFFGWNVTKTQVTIFRWIETILSWNQVAEQIVSMLLLFLIIPIIFGLIDQSSTEKALALNETSNNAAPKAAEEDDDSKKKNA